MTLASGEGTLGAQELPPKRSMTSNRPSLGPTHYFKKRPYDFRDTASSCLSFQKNTFSKPSDHHGACLLSLLYFTKAQGTLMDPQMDPKIDPARLILGDP